MVFEQYIYIYIYMYMYMYIYSIYVCVCVFSNRLSSSILIGCCLRCSKHIWKTGWEPVPSISSQLAGPRCQSQLCPSQGSQGAQTQECQDFGAWIGQIKISLQFWLVWLSILSGMILMIWLPQSMFKIDSRNIQVVAFMLSIGSFRCPIPSNEKQAS